MFGPESIDLSGATWRGPGSQKAAKEDVEVRGGRLGNVQKTQDIQKGAATLPYEGPKAAADLKDKQLKALLDIQQNAQRFLAAKDQTKVADELAKKDGEISDLQSQLEELRQIVLAQERGKATDDDDLLDEKPRRRARKPEEVAA